MLNALFVRRVFPESRVVLLDDSGPLLPAPFAPRCQQRAWRELWGFDDSILKDCGTACPDPDEYLMDVNRAVAANMRGSGLMVSKADGILPFFYGFGYNAGAADCAAGPDALPPPLSTSAFACGLSAVRAALGDAVPAFFADGDKHVLSTGPEFYEITAEHTRAADWFAQLLATGRAEAAGQLDTPASCARE
jgi:hypothetical protein